MAANWGERRGLSVDRAGWETRGRESVCRVGPKRDTWGMGTEGAELGRNENECFMRPSRQEGVESAGRSELRSAAAR